MLLTIDVIFLFTIKMMKIITFLMNHLEVANNWSYINIYTNLSIHWPRPL